MGTWAILNIEWEGQPHIYYEVQKYGELLKNIPEICVSSGTIPHNETYEF